jgi:hypothetical protein
MIALAVQKEALRHLIIDEVLKTLRLQFEKPGSLHFGQRAIGGRRADHREGLLGKMEELGRLSLPWHGQRLLRI